MAGFYDIAKEVGLYPVEVEKGEDGKVPRKISTDAAFDELWDRVIERLKGGEKVAVRGFGTFQAKLLKGRTLSSPLLEGGTGSFDDRLVIRFHASTQAKAKINEGGPKKKQAKVAGKAAPQPAKKAAPAPAPKKLAKPVKKAAVAEDEDDE